VDEVVLLVLIALSFPIAAVVAIVLSIRTRRNLAALTQRIDRLEAQLRAAGTAPVSPPEAAPEVAEPAAASPQEPEPPSEPEPAAIEPEPVRAPVPAVPPAAPPDAVGRPGLEETLGTRGAVWVGGIALALGGLFLVRYSIEQNLLSPVTRVALGGLFALLLAGAGEWLRRRDQRIALPGIPSANVPSVLTAAGSCTAFAVVYAAYALYDLIAPGLAFAMLGAVAVLAMVAATLHGPALAALGLVGAMGSPLLVSSEDPQPIALVLYLAFVVLAAYGVARLRLWRRLAIAAAVGALAWAMPILAIEEPQALAAMVHLAVQTGLAAFFLVAGPYRTASDEAARTDRPASLVLLAFALGAVAVSATVAAGDLRPVFAGFIAVILLATGLRFAPAAPAAAWSGLVVAGALLVWPIRTLLAQSPEGLFWQSGDAFALRPDALGAYLAFAIVAPPAVAGASLVRLGRGSALPLRIAAWILAAATLTPLAALVAAYWRIAEWERSLSFALVAGLVAAGFVSGAAWLTRHSRSSAPEIRLSIGGLASAALAALALGLTFTLDKGMLTVAFALTALGTAWIAERTSIPALRYAVGAAGLLVLGRLAWSPTIVPGNPGPFLVNWLLWGYGIPAASFLLASRILERRGRDRIVRLTESLGIAFSALLIFFEIRHALHEGDPLAPVTSLLDAGLVATQSLAFAIILTGLDIRRGDPVYRYGALAFKVLGILLAGGGVLVVQNPFLTGQPVAGGPVFNALIAAYLLPALLAGLLALVERRGQPLLPSWISAVLGLLLITAYLGLEIRRIVHGPSLSFWHGFTQGEQWAYSVALLAIGIALLGVGLLRDLRYARLGSAVYLVAAVLKVFIADLAHLEGVMRALSFIGLGLVLIGIGLVYQRLLAQRPGHAAASH
jgi:uncharacterized membrane protein